MMEQTHREGELAIVLVREGEPTPLSRLTFSLVMLEGRLALGIGGLQGPSEGGKRMVIDATRILYGLRPKDATLLAARALARALGANPVHAVSDALHVRGTFRNDPKICSYDAYWLERGARACPAFGFAFPPLAAPVAGPSGRDGVKNAIVRAMEAFVAERCPKAERRDPASAPALSSGGSAPEVVVCPSITGAAVGPEARRPGRMRAQSPGAGLGG